MKTDTKKYKGLLEKELVLVESELETVASKNPDQKGDWEAKAGDIEVLESDENEVADKFEEFEGNRGIADKLEARLAEIKKALEKIEKGTYGICEKGGEPIEEKRLMANPAAATCMKHMKS